MGVLLGALGRILLWAAGSIIGKLIVGLGVGVVAYTGVDALSTALTAQINTALGGIDSIYTDPINVLGFREALNIITSGYVAKFGTQTAYRFALRRAGV